MKLKRVRIIYGGIVNDSTYSLVTGLGRRGYNVYYPIDQDVIYFQFLFLKVHEVTPEKFVFEVVEKPVDNGSER